MNIKSDVIVAPSRSDLIAIATRAKQFADENVFPDFEGRKSAKTLEAYHYNIQTLERCLRYLGFEVGDLVAHPQNWKLVTGPMIVAFREWMMTHEGYAVQTVNLKLSTIKTYANLAKKAGYMTEQQAMEIRAVDGYSQTEAKRKDGERQAAMIPTRKSTKKEEANVLTVEEANNLKLLQPHTPQGWRDTVMFCIFLDHGLRREEVALMLVENIDMDNRTFRFYRPKVDKWQTMKMSLDLFYALCRYPMPDSGPLLVASKRSGELLKEMMGAHSIYYRVKYLGYCILGIPNLSPHDLRHYAITQAVHRGSNRYSVQQFGGWDNDKMVDRYTSDLDIANEDIILPDPVLGK